ncbi:MAG: serine/threonine-protein kinase, partial [Peptococcaceae bacterium]|nr:serine/threonine-protein kinase [Peptococcaceae bacterium]
MRRCLGCMGEYEDINNTCPHCGYAWGTPAKEAYHITPGSILQEKYLIGRVLGYGGFGVTYMGFDLRLERKIAVKEYLPGDFSTRMPGQTVLTVYSGEAEEQFVAGLRSFLEEAQRLAKFNALPGVVDIYDSFLENQTGYIVMEYLEGRTVKEILADEGKMDFPRAKEIILRVLTPLKVVHQSGIIHRDIAPDNIFIMRDDEVRLLDFGASRYATTLHSKSLSVILKPGYAPEEQYRGRGNQGPWSDVYAAAASFYKMITGITPVESMERKMGDTLREPSKLGAVLPKSAENAIMNALNVDPADRIQSADAFEAALLSEEVARNKVKQKKADAGKLPLWAKIGGGVLGVLVLCLGILMTVDMMGGGLLASIIGTPVGEGQTRVPYVLKVDVDDAAAAADKAGLIFQVMGRDYEDKVPKDLVMKQEPESNRVISAGGMLRVWISGGKAPPAAMGGSEDGDEANNEDALIPDVTSWEIGEAIAMLRAAGLSCALAYEESDSVARDVVIRQDIPAGEALAGR